MKNNNKWILNKGYGMLIGMCLLVTGCSGNGEKITEPSTTTKTEKQTQETKTNEKLKAYSFENMGIMIEAPEEYVNKNELSLDVFEELDDEMVFNVTYFSPEYWALLTEMSNKKIEDQSEAEILDFQQKAMEFSSELLTIIRCKEENKDAALEKVAPSGSPTEIGRQDGYVYLVFTQDITPKNISAASMEGYEACKKLLPQMETSIQLIPIVLAPTLSQSLPTFDSVDLMGNRVNNDIFKNHKVTMINFWGTFCGPCISEMPDLATLAKDMPEGVQLIGIVTDVKTNQSENLQLAKDILKKAGADFTNIKLDEGLESYTKNLVGVPTTIFVDADGNLLGEPLVGSRGKEEYQAAYEEFLK